MEKFKLNGEIVIITGGLGLLGRQYIKAVKEIGGLPISLDIRNPDELIGAWCVKCDITKEEELIAVREDIKKSFKAPIYGLINNAAIDPKVQKDSPNMSNLRLEDYPSDFFRKEWEVSVLGSLLTTKVFGSEMVANKRGSIINISSILGLVGPNCNFYDSINVIKPIGYTIVKHAIIGMTKGTAVEWAKYGIRCNTLAPGGVFNNHSEEFVNELSKLIPLGRMANKEEYNSAIQFLLTEASSYMTGQILPIEGGFTTW